MARGIEVKITDWNGVRKRLVDVVPERTTKTIMRVFNQGAARIAAKANASVPVQTGKLKATINVSKAKINDKGGVSATVYAGNPTTRTGTGDAMQLARIIEFGSAHSPAQPFLIPAFRAEKPKIDASVRRALRKVLKDMSE